MSKLSHLLVLNKQFGRILCKDSFGFGFALFGTLWPILEIFRKLYLFTGSCRLLRRLFDYARGSTQKNPKKKLKIRAEFITSVSYRPQVINNNILEQRYSCQHFNYLKCCLHLHFSLVTCISIH